MTDLNKDKLAADIKHSVIWIHDPSGIPQGLGFLISSGYLATCAHVVEQCLGGPGSVMHISFLESGEEGEAWVAPEYWKPSTGDDVAILRLHPYWSELPAGAHPARLGSALACSQDRITYLGLPPSEGNRQKYLWATGKALAPVPVGGKREMLQFQATDLNHGMSGAPILNLDTGLVIGMVSEFLSGETYSYKFATTSDTIQWAFSRFELTAPGLIDDYNRRVVQDCSKLLLPQDFLEGGEPSCRMSSSPHWPTWWNCNIPGPRGAGRGWLHRNLHLNRGSI